MSFPAEMAERHGRMLAELGELGLSLARDLQGRALSAETPQEASQLADAFNRISRSVRQSLALEAKLLRDSLRDAREERDRQVRETELRKAARKAELKKRVCALVWTETELPEIGRLMVDEAPHHIEREAESETFLDEPVEAQIARIRKALGLDEDWADDDDEPDQAELEPDGDDEPDEVSPTDPRPHPSNPPDDHWSNST